MAVGRRKLGYECLGLLRGKPGLGVFATGRVSGLTVPAVLLIGVLLTDRAVQASPCGDDVGGQNIPCSCGDIVVSDVVLSSDPVTTEVCPSDALLVRADADDEGITIDLRGKTLRGRGSGTAIWVLRGGRGGARVVSSSGTASLLGFHDGIIGHGPDALAFVENLSVVDSVRDGIRVSGSDFMIRATEVRGAGRDGFSIAGKGFQLAGTRAMASGRFGYFVMGQGGAIGAAGAGATAEDSGKAGFKILGMGHRVVECVAVGNGRAGLSLHGMQFEIRGCLAEGNGGDGITGLGSGWRLAANRAVNNDGNGIFARGGRMVDEGGNSGVGNRGHGQLRPVIQCEIGGVPCAP